MDDQDLGSTSSDSLECFEVPDGFLEGTAADYLPPTLRSMAEDVGPELSEVDGYRLLRELGHGGFGRVYLAEASESILPQHRHVAIKLVHVGASPKERQRFQSELAALRSLSHPGIVTLLDSGVAALHLTYLVMAFVDGQTVDAFCRDRRCSWREIVRLMIQACGAIEHAHSRGVLHCDLKPSNILVTEAGEVVVTDFGLVRFFQDFDAAHVSVSTSVRGTPAYMAPEQLVPQADRDTAKLSIAVDVFGLGATLYKLLSGYPPRPAKSTLSAIAYAVAGEPIPRLKTQKLVCECPPALLHIVEHAMHLEPDRRYRNVSQLRDDLENLLANRPVQARRHSALDRFGLWIRREPMLAGFSAVAGLALVVAIGLAFAWTRAVESRNSLLKSHLDESLSRLNEYQDSVGQLQAGQRLPGEARRKILELLRDQRQTLVKSYPQDLQLPYSLAQAHFVLAEYYNENGHKAAAITELRQAAEIFEELRLESFESDPVRFDLFHTYHKMGTIQFGMGQEREGETAYKISSEYIESLVQQHTDNLDYADCYAAQLILNAKYSSDLTKEEVERLYLRVLEVVASLHARTEGKPKYWRHRIDANMGLAEVAMQKRDYRAALSHAQQAVDDAQEALNAESDDWVYQLDSLRALMFLAEIAAEAKQAKIARETLSTAEKRLAWLMEARPDLYEIKVHRQRLDQLLANF